MTNKDVIVLPRRPRKVRLKNLMKRVSVFELNCHHHIGSVQQSKEQGKKETRNSMKTPKKQKNKHTSHQNEGMSWISVKLGKIGLSINLE